MQDVFDWVHDLSDEERARAKRTVCISSGPDKFYPKINMCWHGSYAIYSSKYFIETE